jgi:hypothetical protein
MELQVSKQEHTVAAAISCMAAAVICMALVVSCVAETDRACVAAPLLIAAASHAALCMCL